MATAVYVFAGGIEAIYESMGLLAAAAIVVGVVRNKPSARKGWLTLALSQALFGTGDVIYFSFLSDPAPYPSIADGFYLPGAVTLGVALIWLVSGSQYGRDVISYADALVVAVAAGLLAWSALFSGSLGSGTDMERAVSVAYPLLDLLFLAVLVRLLFVRGTRTPAFGAVVAAVLLLLASDAWYVPVLTGRYVAGTWRDAGWLLSYVIFGAAALHPSMKTLVAPRAGKLPVRRVLVLGLGLSAFVIAVAAICNRRCSGTLMSTCSRGQGASRPSMSWHASSG